MMATDPKATAPRRKAAWRPGRQQARLLWKQSVHQSVLYLPALLMGVLALGTYWLVRVTPAFVAAESARPVRHEADYFMRNFTVRNFDDAGTLRNEMQGVEARHYPDTDTLEIDQGRIRSVGLGGRVTLSTANRVLSNGDGSEVQLIGNAVVLREASRDANGQLLPRMAFKSAFLQVFLNTEQVKSHVPVEFTQGNDQFNGDTFAYDNLTGVVDLKGRARAVLAPKAGPKSAPKSAP